MGCDIHAVIEYENQYNSIEVFARGELWVSRDYELFSALAFGDGGITDNLPYPPRGLPLGCSDTVRELFFVESEEAIKIWAEIEGEQVRPEELINELGDLAREEYELHGRLPHPELHTASWLNFDELEVALAHGNLAADKLSPDFQAVVAAMRKLSEHFGSGKVRLVFWFDG